MNFTLHPDLKRDGIAMGQFSLSDVLLINDAHYPWFVLVPKRADISDTIDLTDGDHAQLWKESQIFSRGIMHIFNGEKLNVAALGNMTPQLHVHHIVRYKIDAAWPGPVWGKVPMQPYEDTQITDIQYKLVSAHMNGFSPI